MSALEQAIREAAQTGRLSGLTLWPSQGGWQANARWQGSTGWTVEIHADPVVAVTAALKSTTRFDHTKVDAKPDAGVFD